MLLLHATFSLSRFATYKMLTAFATDEMLSSFATYDMLSSFATYEMLTTYATHTCCSPKHHAAEGFLRLYAFTALQRLCAEPACTYSNHADDLGDRTLMGKQHLPATTIPCGVTV